MQHKIERLQRFTKIFIIEGMSIIVKYNYFYINDNFIHQIKGTAMDTHAAVVYANLTCEFLEVKLFNELPEIFSYYMVELFLKNYFRLSDDVKHSWKESIDVSQSWELMKSLDPDIKLIFENVFTVPQ